MRTVLTLFVVAVVLLAGCGETTSTAEGGGGNFTAAAVPTDHPMDDRPPGVGRAGLSDPIELADAHAEALENANFTVRSESVLRDPGGPVRSSVSGVHHHEPGRDLSTTIYGQRTPFTHETTGGIANVWANETTGVSRFWSDRFLEYGAGEPVADASRHDRLYSLLAYVRSGETTVSDGEYRIHSDGVPALFDPFFAESLRSIDSWDQTVVVGRDGVVRSVRIDFSGTIYTGGTSVPVTGTYSLQFTDIGTTQVERPDWVSEAVNGTRQTRTNSLKHPPA